MIHTLDELISALQAVRDSHPQAGRAEVAIHDADTGWHLGILRCRFSRQKPERLLLEGEYHSSEDTLCKP